MESLLDPLTGLANRRCFDERVNEAVREVAAEGGDLCILMGDVDHFKKFNDTWGHATGDQVLRLVAQCFKGNTKGRDTAARYGGEEFVVVLPQTSVDNAITIAEQIRRPVESEEDREAIDRRNVGLDHAVDRCREIRSRRADCRDGQPRRCLPLRGQTRGQKSRHVRVEC